MLHPSSTQVTRQRRGEAFVFRCGRNGRDPDSGGVKHLYCDAGGVVEIPVQMLYPYSTDGVLPNCAERSHQTPHDFLRVERADQLRVERSDALRDGKAKGTPTNAGTAALLRNAAG